MISAFGVVHLYDEIAKYYMEQRPATEKEMAAVRAKKPIRSKLRPKKYSAGWSFADDDGNRGTLATGPSKPMPNYGPSMKQVKQFSRYVGGEK